MTVRSGLTCADFFIGSGSKSNLESNIWSAVQDYTAIIINCQNSL